MAIIGGFLVSRVITLASEKGSIEKRLREINTELENKQKMLDMVELELLEDDVDDFVYDHAEDILISEKPIQDILKEDNSTDLTQEELSPYIESLIAIYDKILDEINKTDIDYSLPRNFDDFVKDNNIKIDNNKKWHEIAYDIIYKEHQRNLRKQISSNPLLGNYSIPFAPDLINLNMPTYTSSTWYLDQVKARNSLRNEILILQGMKKEQENSLNKYSRISGLWSGLAVLAYSSIVSIIIPITLLPYPVGKYDDLATRKLLLLLFISQLIMLFIYLTVSMYKLTREK